MREKGLFSFVAKVWECIMNIWDVCSRFDNNLAKVWVGLIVW